MPKHMTHGTFRIFAHSRIQPHQDFQSGAALSRGIYPFPFVIRKYIKDRASGRQEYPKHLGEVRVDRVRIWLTGWLAGWMDHAGHRWDFLRRASFAVSTSCISPVSIIIVGLVSSAIWIGEIIPLGSLPSSIFSFPTSSRLTCLQTLSSMYIVSSDSLHERQTVHLWRDCSALALLTQTAHL